MIHALRFSKLSRLALSLSLAAAGVVCSSPAARAVITVGPRSVLTSADYLAGGRGQYIGQWGAFIGTPIGPRHFATANHVGNGGGGNAFVYNNGTSTQTVYQAVFVASQDDLAIWRLADASPSFTRWAPIYTASNEIGRGLTAIGRGTDKGAEVRLPQGTGALRGYQWGAADGLVSGGTNVVTSAFALVGAPAGFGGDFLYFEFDQAAGPTECMYSSGDSGGAVFIVDPADGVTKLAGINSLVDGNFSYTQNGPYFPAAIWDARGFWVGSSGADGTLIPANDPAPVPAGSYATRVSSRVGFIRGIIGNPPTCGSADFNGDGDTGTDADIEAFFACLAGSCCATCGSADFNGDGDTGTDSDIEAFFRVLAGGNC
jgi:hypothetical protein